MLNWLRRRRPPEIHRTADESRYLVLGVAQPGGVFRAVLNAVPGDPSRAVRLLVRRRDLTRWRVRRPKWDEITAEWRAWLLGNDAATPQPISTHDLADHWG